MNFFFFAVGELPALSVNISMYITFCEFYVRVLVNVDYIVLSTFVRYIEHFSVFIIFQLSL